MVPLFSLCEPGCLRAVFRCSFAAAPAGVRACIQEHGMEEVWDRLRQATGNDAQLVAFLQCLLTLDPGARADFAPIRAAGGGRRKCCVVPGREASLSPNTCSHAIWSSVGRGCRMHSCNEGRHSGNPADSSRHSISGVGPCCGPCL